jgi:hypothetical protein
MQGILIYPVFEVLSADCNSRPNKILKASDQTDVSCLDHSWNLIHTLKHHSPNIYLVK